MISVGIITTSVVMQGGGSWTPPGFGDSLSLWHKRTGPFDLESGDILRWHDSGGSDIHGVQSTPGNRPTPEPDGFGVGISSVRFQFGDDDHLTAHGLAPLLAGVDVPFVFAEQIESLGDGGTSLCLGHDSGQQIHTIQYPDWPVGDDKLRHFRRNDSGGNVNRESSGDFPSGKHVVVTEYDGAATRVYIDDPDTAFTTLLAMDVGQCTFNTFAIGAQVAAGSAFRPLDHRRGSTLCWAGVSTLESFGAGTRALVMAQLKQDIGI